MRPRPLYFIALALLMPLYGCAGSSGSSASSLAHKGSATGSTGKQSHHRSQPAQTIKPQSPAPVENNPPGDIPDSTLFLPYRSRSGNFSIKVPEGWARRTSRTSVSFSSKLNVITASFGKENTPPSVKRARTRDIPGLRSTVPAFQPAGTSVQTLPGGKALLINYRANSPRNAVTGKRYRLVIERFEFFRAGREVDLSLSSPVGADNVDPWRIVSQSFRWS